MFVMVIMEHQALGDSLRLLMDLMVANWHNVHLITMTSYFSNDELFFSFDIQCIISLL